MSSPHWFDRYLGNTSSDPGVEKRELGNILLEDAQAAAKDWEHELNRFLPIESNMNALPDGSWLLKVTFTLSRPFTSKTESEFHSHEERQDGKPKEWFEVQNPIVRDHLTGLPLVKPTTCKGHLRFAARMEGLDDKIVTGLFGTIRADEGGQAGRLHFFPTFFTGDIQREVVTPLKRATRTPARGPIDIEVVPAGAKGTFCLLYIPYPKGPAWSPEQIAHDLEAVAQAVKAMFLEYGFSAKKTAGWGVVKDTALDGHLWARGLMWPPPEKRVEGSGAQPFERPDDTYLGLMDEAGMPKAGLRKPDGTWISNKEFNALVDKPCSLSVYKRFRSWYGAHSASWQRQLAGAEAASATVPIRTYTVESVTALCDLAASLAAAMRGEHANG